jgi:hypothetical protein
VLGSQQAVFGVCKAMSAFVLQFQRIVDKKTRKTKVLLYGYSGFDKLESLGFCLHPFGGPIQFISAFLFGFLN